MKCLPCLTSIKRVGSLKPAWFLAASNLSNVPTLSLTCARACVAYIGTLSLSLYARKRLDRLGRLDQASNGGGFELPTLFQR